MHPALVSNRPRQGAGDPQLLWVRNPKAASHWLWTGGFRDLTHAKTPLSDVGMCFQPHKCKVRLDPVSFAVVGDPIKVFISAWKEIVCRGQMLRGQMLRMCRGKRSCARKEYYRWLQPGAPTAKMATDLAQRGWGNMTENEATQLFRTFADDLFQGRETTKQVFHAWPQAMKLHTWVPLDYIVNLSSFSASTMAMFPTEHNTLKGGHFAAGRCKASLGRLRLTDADQRKLCRLLHVDYECFGFDLPQACQKSV